MGCSNSKKTTDAVPDNGSGINNRGDNHNNDTAEVANMETEDSGMSMFHGLMNMTNLTNVSSSFAHLWLFRRRCQLKRNNEKPEDESPGERVERRQALENILMQLGEPQNFVFSDVMERIREGFGAFGIYRHSLQEAQEGPREIPPEIAVVLGETDELKLDYMVFLFMAYKLGYGSGYRDACLVAFGCSELLKQNDMFDFELWLQFFMWMLAGTFYFPGRDYCTKDEASMASRPLTLEEYQSELPYEEVAPKEAYDAFVFVSHRWLTPKHPDPQRTQKQLLVTSLNRVQSFLDYLIDPSSMNPPPKETDFSADQGELANSIFNGELLWSIYFFARCQPHVMVWYDFHSIPQGSDDASRTQRKACLDEIRELCRQRPLCILSNPDYMRRAWCFFEALQCLMSDTTGGQWLIYDETSGSASLNRRVMRDIIMVFYGRFCLSLENYNNSTNDNKNNDPARLLQSLNMACTNGSDLSFLAQILVNDSANPGYQMDESGFLVHPYFTAFRRFVEDILLPRITEEGANNNNASEQKKNVIEFWEPLVGWMQNHQEELLNKFGADSRAQHGGMTGGPAEFALTLRYRYPDKGLNVAVELKDDWNPPFQENTRTVAAFLTEVADSFVALGGPSTVDWSKHHSPTFRDRLNKLMDSMPFHTVTVHVPREEEVVNEEE